MMDAERGIPKTFAMDAREEASKQKSAVRAVWPRA